jgi:hypothetical protein
MLCMLTGPLLPACAAAKSAAPTGAAGPFQGQKSGAGAEREPTAAGAEPGMSPARPTATIPAQQGWAIPPPKEALPELTTLEQAESELTRSQQQLEQGIDEVRANARQLSEPTPAICLSACQALGSMRRAVGGICRLAGDGSERCERARSTLARSETRVLDAGCSCDPE